MTLTIPRRRYVELFGPTVGDKVRLGDTDLIIKIEKDLIKYGDEVVFGGRSRGAARLSGRECKRGRRERGRGFARPSKRPLAVELTPHLAHSVHPEVLLPHPLGLRPRHCVTSHSGRRWSTTGLSLLGLVVGRGAVVGKCGFGCYHG